MLNLPTEHVDRTHLSIILGFLKTTGPRLKECYKKQFVKMVEFLKGQYIESLNNKFGKKPVFKSLYHSVKRSHQQAFIILNLSLIIYNLKSRPFLNSFILYLTTFYNKQVLTLNLKYNNDS